MINNTGNLLLIGLVLFITQQIFGYLSPFVRNPSALLQNLKQHSHCSPPHQLLHMKRTFNMATSKAITFVTGNKKK
jgi:hypothetical protein